MGVDRVLIQGAKPISPEISIFRPASMSNGQDTYAEPYEKKSESTDHNQIPVTFRT